MSPDFRNAAILIASLLTSSLAMAQVRDPLRIRQAQQEPVQQIDIGFTKTFGVQVNYFNLGDVGFIENFLNENGIPEFTTDTAFATGFIGASETGSPFTEGKSAFWSFRDPVNGGTADQADLVENTFLNDLNGDGIADSFTMSALTTTAPGVNLLDEPVNNPNGWDIEYTRRILKLGDRFRLSGSIGAGFSNLDSMTTGDFENVQLLVNPFTYELPAGGPAISVDRETVFASNGEFLIPSEATADTSFLVDRDIRSTGTYDIDASLANFRIGPTLEIDLTSRLYVQLSAGFAVMYFDSRTDITQDIDDITERDDDGNVTGFANLRRITSTSNQAEWLTGYYADADINYKVNERFRLFSGFQYQTADDVRSTADQQTVEVELSSPTTMQVGFGYQF